MNFLLFLFLGMASAQSVQVVHEVAQSTQTVVQAVDVSSYTPTNVSAATSSGTIAGTFAIEVYNLAANSNTINCGFSTSLSTISTNAWYGREVAPGTGVIYQVLSKTPLYCMTQSITATTRATITQLK